MEERHAAIGKNGIYDASIQIQEKFGLKMKQLQSPKETQSLLTLSLSAGGMPDERLFRIEGKTELFKIVDKPNTLAVHFHTSKNKSNESMQEENA